MLKVIITIFSQTGIYHERFLLVQLSKIVLMYNTAKNSAC